MANAEHGLRALAVEGPMLMEKLYAIPDRSINESLKLVEVAVSMLEEVWRRPQVSVVDGCGRTDFEAEKARERINDSWSSRRRCSRRRAPPRRDGGQHGGGGAEARKSGIGGGGACADRARKRTDIEAATIVHARTELQLLAHNADPFHDLSCRDGGDITTLRNAVRDAIFRCARRASLEPVLERVGLPAELGMFLDVRRPADVLIEEAMASPSDSAIAAPLIAATPLA